MIFRLCLFQVRMKFGKHFTPSCVFGSTCKTWLKGKSNPLTLKWEPFNCKILYTCKLPSNQVLWIENQTRERERERERELEGKVNPKRESLNLRQSHRHRLLIVVAWSSSSLPNTNWSLVILFSLLLKLIVAAKQRSEHCHLIFVATEARYQHQTQIRALYSFSSPPPCSSSPPPFSISSLPPSRSSHPWLISSSPPKIFVTTFRSTLLWPDFNQVSQSTSLFPSISHSFFLPLSIWLSLRVNGFILIFVSLKSLYLAILYYKICLWETSRKFAFSRMLPNTWKYFLI